MRITILSALAGIALSAISLTTHGAEPQPDKRYKTIATDLEGGPVQIDMQTYRASGSTAHVWMRWNDYEAVKGRKRKQRSGHTLSLLAIDCYARSIRSEGSSTYDIDSELIDSDGGASPTPVTPGTYGEAAADAVCNGQTPRQVREVEGTVYAYVLDGVRRYSSKPPPEGATNSRTIRYSFREFGE